MSGLMKLVAAAVGVITLGSAAAVLLVPPSPQERAVRRDRQAQRLVDLLTQEIWNYYHEHGEFPPGDGIGTASLVKALRKPCRYGLPHFGFIDEMLNGVGDLRNPVDPDRLILYYRNNRERQGSGVRGRNGSGFDLWGKDSEGVEDGVNNWSSLVPTQ
jgi:hypothetical protein